MIFPIMCGWIAQKYSTVPAVANDCLKLSSVSSASERNLPSFSATTCGMSSPLTQVTVVPAFTVRTGGSKVKLAIFTSASAANAGETASNITKPARLAAITCCVLVIVSFRPLSPSSARKRRVGDGERLAAHPHRDAGDAEHRAKPIRRHRHGARRGRRPSYRLREAGGSRGMEGHVAFDLLHDLVDVAVEHGHRTEPLQHGERLHAVVGAPAPFGINRPERDMGEDDDRG